MAKLQGTIQMSQQKLAKTNIHASVANKQIKLHSNNARWLLCNSEID